MVKKASMKKPQPFGQDWIRWLQSLAALVMTVGVFSVAWELFALHAQRSFLAAFDELGPHVSSDDLLHLSHLQAGCRMASDAVFPWRYAAPGTAADVPTPRPQSSTTLLHRGDPRLLDELRRCPEVDIFLPPAARGRAGCAAVAGPLKFLQSRLLPDWALDVELFDIVTKQKRNYLELCPSTPMLFLAPEHLLKVATSASWPKTKPVYLMAPGLDLKTKTPQLTKSALELTDVVLCRTRRCDQGVRQFLERQPSAKNTRVIYTSQVTSDPTNFARRLLGDGAACEKNRTHFATPRFAYTTWDITSKATQDVISCWSSHAEQLPPLDVYLLKELRGSKPTDGDSPYNPFPAESNTNVMTLDALAFARAFGNSTFFVCPTAEDDCLDLARASGGVIVTADASPMNELISGPTEGLLFPAEPATNTSEDSLLLPPAPASYSSSDLCSAVLSARASTPLRTRMELAAQARRHFNEDAKFFLLRMLELRAFSRHKHQFQTQEDSQNLRHST
jgi:hypothetical protein